MMPMYGKDDPPPQPNLKEAAEATAAANLESTKIAAAANRVNQVTPYGNLTYSTNSNTGGFNQSGYDAAMADYNKQLSVYNSQPATNNNVGGMGGMAGLYGNFAQNNRGAPPIAPNRNTFTTAGGPETYTATQTLSPAEQAKLTANNNLQLGLLGTAQKGLAGVDSYLSKGFDFSQLPAQAVNAGQTAQDAVMARLTPQFNIGENELRTRLTNQGVAPGSEAWNNDFRNFNNSKNDAYSQAALNGISVGQQARQQSLQEQEFGRTEGLNMVNALRTGNQVQSPNFVNTPQQATTAGADYFGAANAGYQNQLSVVNASNASSAGLFGGLATGLGSLVGGPLGSAAFNYFTKK